MSGADGFFEADWLTLREQADHSARSDSLARRLSAWLTSRSDAAAVSIVDLGAGRGSNLRWLAPRLDASQAWTLVDHDASLLEDALASPAPKALGGQDISLATRHSDLNDLQAVLPDPVDVISASALCDLVSEAWIECLAARAEVTGSAVLLALTVDGRRAFSDRQGAVVGEDDDRHLCELFNAHQRQAKGLGAALGPDASRLLPEALERHGMQVTVERSDWRLPPGDPGGIRLGCALLEDWAGAALEQAPEEAPLIERWHRRRRAAIVSGELGLLVGHADVLGLPE